MFVITRQRSANESCGCTSDEDACVAAPLLLQSGHLGFSVAWNLLCVLVELTTVLED